MIVEKEVTIYVESFIDALEIVDKMNVSLPHAVIFMNEEEFLEGKCHVVIDKTLFMFLPAHSLFRPLLKERDMTAIDEVRAFGGWRVDKMKEKEEE